MSHVTSVEIMDAEGHTTIFSGIRALRNTDSRHAIHCAHMDFWDRDILEWKITDGGIRATVNIDGGRKAWVYFA